MPTTFILFSYPIRVQHREVYTNILHSLKRVLW